MRFPYHQIDDDTIETAGNIQSSSSNTNTTEDDTIFSPSRALLPYWPFWCGYCQIGIGFLCGIFGALQVFVVPFLISLDAELGLYSLNFFGAAIWSGLMLVLAGSCAVRASSVRDITSVTQFYVVSVIGFLACLAMFILILWCSVDTQIIDSTKCNEFFPFHSQECKDVLEKVHKYSVISLLSAVWCLLGSLLLFLSTTNYFCPVMFGEVHLMKKLGICWLPCCFYLPPKEVLSPYKQEQNIKV
ncbi:uncharacterized protein LOC132745208 isoform X2 [Ruditapes philippinarum]|uniref:uncharacterized protein LOC132745208 isoform X2 n=1 Tax=Ruditapes philippinarum TaxID=129788 RepID=UPI00295BB087|nr:uncharacterized protein LOC132745208 isoform X2 [Ruditapes philippinarum]